MVTSDVAQLSSECNEWRTTLRSFRDEFIHLKNRLQAIAGRQTNREILLEIEHFDNQFHIQLINIHDLKQSVKTHQRRVSIEESSGNGMISDGTLAEHETLFDEYTSLGSVLRELQDEFDLFISHIR